MGSPLSIVDSQPLPQPQAGSAGGLSIVDSKPLPTESQWTTDPIVGAFKGAASTLFHTGDLIRSGEKAVKGALPDSVQKWLDSAPQGVKDFVGYGDRPLDSPEVQQGTTPSNTAQKVGYYA